MPAITGWTWKKKWGKGPEGQKRKGEMGGEWKGGWEKGREVAPAVLGGALRWPCSLITSQALHMRSLTFRSFSDM